MRKPPPWTTLGELYAFIDGSPFKGITTRPKGDAEDIRTHEAVLKLEKQGKVKRLWDIEDGVVWGPSDWQLLRDKSQL